MFDEHTPSPAASGTILVLGGTGKTGRRVADRLRQRGMRIRIGSRSAKPAFDWSAPEGWDAVLAGVTAAYINYAPDLAVPGAQQSVQAFVDAAMRCGVERLVLLSGRGEEEAQACERVVQASDAEWTIVRASWFNQNFSEGAFSDMVRGGAIALPAADIPEPFVDVDDIADVVTAALTEQGHAYETYEVTGPRLLTFSELAREIGVATGRELPFMRISANDFARAINRTGVPGDVAWLLNYLFETVLDGRNAYLGDGVRRALGREPRDFAAFAREVAAAGLWRAAA